MHQNSLLLFERYAKAFFAPTARVLEIGPNIFPSDYCRMSGIPVEQWDTLDLRNDPRLTYPNAPEYHYPIAENTYDIVISGQVMEHVRKIWRWVRELERICKPGGHVIIICAVSWPYHAGPVDCWRSYPEGMKDLLEDHTSLEIVECRCESLETPQYKRHTPGRSLEWMNPKLRWFYRIAGKFGFPVECSYDLLTIAKKRT